MNAPAFYKSTVDQRPHSAAKDFNIRADQHRVKRMRVMFIVISLMVGSIMSLAYLSSANAQMGRGGALQARV